jgi:hypothetical protein
MKRFFLTLIFLLGIFLTPLFLGKVEAGYFKFDPTSSTAENGGTFQVAVVVDAGSDQIRSTDIYVTFDATLLEAQSVSAGTFFPTVTNNITSGQVYIAAMVDDGATTKTGSGTVATITFKALKEGAGTLSFDCSSSLIVKADANSTDVLECSANGTNAVTVGTGTSNGTNTNDTTGQTSQVTTTPTQLPRSGSFEDMLKWSQLGIMLVLLGGVVRLLLL